MLTAGEQRELCHIEQGVREQDRGFAARTDGTDVFIRHGARGEGRRDNAVG